MEEQFKVGDRVMVWNTPEGDSMTPRNGDIGTVCICKRTSVHVGVKFDKWFFAGHDCDGTVEYGYGYYVLRECLKSVEEILTIKKWLQTKKDSETTLQLMSVPIRGKERKITIKL